MRIYTACRAGITGKNFEPWKGRVISMEKDKNTRMSGKESAAITLRAFRLLCRIYPGVIISMIANIIWNALTPYMGIWFSARIIGELAGGRSPEVLKNLVPAALACAALISLVGGIIGRWANAESRRTWFAEQYLFVDKNLEMDFVRLDRSETQKLLHTIEDSRKNSGWGLPRLLWSLQDLIAPVFSVLGGAVLVISFFTSRVPENAGSWTVLDNPAFLVLLIVVMAGIPCISSLLANQGGKYYVVNNAKHSLENNLFSWFCFKGHDRVAAGDMRIYRIDKMCMKYGFDRKSLFSSQGCFANLARGKVGVLNLTSNTVSHIFTLLVYLYVCLKAWAGAFGVGEITQYIGALSNIAGSVGQFLRVWGDVRNNAPFLKQTFEYLDLPNDMYQGSLTTEKRGDGDYEVEFRNVSFRYPGEGNWALRNISLKFRVGEHLAVVGCNGSGKTTFIKLLCRLYDPTEGEILLNGIDIRKYNYRQYMDIFAVVFQDFKLFPYTLAENVAASGQYDPEKVRDCLLKAGFGERLEEMKDGISTYLTKKRNDNGVDISGGEAQKIAIARALYKDAPFILLDEPTAALDPLAEAEIYARFHSITGGRTAVYISHRLSSCRFCDKILVFSEGRIVQQGAHESLMQEEKGVYAGLWNAQAQYYTE